MTYATSTPVRLNNVTSSATGPIMNVTITKSIDSGPKDGVTPVVKNSFTAPAGKKARANIVMNPPTTKPAASTRA